MTTKISHISRFFENWAPQSTKLDYDNVGLLIGNFNKSIKRILTSLDLTEEVVDEAISKKCDLIVSHHPLLFKSVKRIDPETKQGTIISKLIRNDIAAFAAHTNLDAAYDGVSFQLARQIGLENIRFLSDDYMLSRMAVLEIPASSSEPLVKALNDAGFTNVNTLAIEDKRDSDKWLKVEIPYDSYQEKELSALIHRQISSLASNIRYTKLENPSLKVGMGALGDFPEALTSKEFLGRVSDQLHLDAIRYTGGADQIKTVAVCGGAGISLASKAMKAGAQAFVTADIKYHDYFLENESFMLLDVGHYESEIPIVKVMQEELKKAFPELEVFETQVSTNPMRIHIKKSHMKQNQEKQNVQV